MSGAACEMQTRSIYWMIASVTANTMTQYRACVALAFVDGAARTADWLPRFGKKTSSLFVGRIAAKQMVHMLGRHGQIFPRVPQLAALRTAQVLVVRTLARDAKLNAVTAGRYLDLLEAYVPDAKLAFWHEQGRREVDFVLETGR